MPGEQPEAIAEFSAVERPSGEASIPTWDATFRGRSGTARFEIRMEVRPAQTGEDYAVTSGSLRARTDSNADELLAASLALTTASAA
jgi:hypothetical protein